MVKRFPYENMVKHKRIEYEGEKWYIDAKAFYGRDGKGILRVYRIDGNVTSRNLIKALEAEAMSCGLAGARIFTED